MVPKPFIGEQKKIYIYTFNTSEVSFPKEPFEDGLVAGPRQAGVAPRSRVPIGLLLPSSQGQQRGVGTPARGLTVWWLVPDHQSHAVVGAFFQTCERGCVGCDGFYFLVGCWGREKTNQEKKWGNINGKQIDVYDSQEAHCRVAKANNCKETWCEGVRATLAAEPVEAAGCRGGVGRFRHPVSHRLPPALLIITWPRTKRRRVSRGAARRRSLHRRDDTLPPPSGRHWDCNSRDSSRLCGESTLTAIWNPAEVNKNVETFNGGLKSKKNKKNEIKG